MRDFTYSDYDCKDEIITDKAHLLEIIKSQVVFYGSTP